MNCFIIAEAGVNHNGDLNLAKELVYEAKGAGANAVKFQMFDTNLLVNKSAEKAEYQKKSSSESSTQYDLLKALELSKESHYCLNEFAKTIDIEFMSTGFDIESVDFLVDMGVKRLKIPSGEITNLPFIQHIAKKKLPIIMSTGMCDLDEVQQAVNIVRSSIKASDFELTLLHCTSNYPVEMCDVNLLAMKTLADKFQLPVGYSDHTLGTLVPSLAVGLGATLIEKHFTLNKSLQGPDHAMSMTPREMKDLVQIIRDTEVILGSGVKKPVNNELPIRDLVRRSITINKSILKGTKLTIEDLTLLRPGNGINPAYLSKVVSMTVRKNLSEGTTLLWEHLEP